MKTQIPALGVLAGALVFGLQAHAATVTFGFSGGGFSGNAVLTIAPNIAPPDPNPACGTLGNNPCRTDPVGAYKITGITGTFSDAANGIHNVAITGLVPINPTNERDPVFDPLVPSSLSYVDYAPLKGLSYNNLFFPNGSPIDCNFPFAGTLVDVFGMAFTVAGGDTVNVWGDGDLHGPGTTTYGVGVTDGHQLLAYKFDGVNGGVVPEPSTWAFMLIGLGGLGYALRRGRRQANRSGAAL